MKAAGPCRTNEGDRQTQRRTEREGHKGLSQRPTLVQDKGERDRERESNRDGQTERDTET